MQFKKIAIRNIISACCSIIVAVILAIRGFGIYSMIISTLFQTFVNNLWNFIYGQKQYRIKLFCSANKIRPFFKIGIFQTGAQIIDYFCARFDILIVGKLLGSEMLGIYSLAKEIVLKLILVINSIVNKVAMPIFSYKNADNDFLRTQYCKMINLLSVVNFPINVFFCVFSYQIVSIFYGEKFIDVAPLVSILSIYGMCVAISNPTGNLVIATGRTDIFFKYTVIRSIISLLLITITALHSIQMVACGQVVLIFIMSYVSWKMLLNKLIQLPIFEFIKTFSRTGLISLVVGFVFYYIVHYNILEIFNPLFQVLIYGILFTLVYLISLFCNNRKNLYNILNFRK
jgi:O-antigen/teichoic acid export membrane protein